MYNCTKGLIMNIVADTSVVISVLFNEASKEKLIGITKNKDLISPASLHWEIGNAISAMFKRGRIDYETSIKALDLYKNIKIRFVDVSLQNSIKIASLNNIYAYDAYFLECSKQYNIPLITLDNRLFEIAKEMKLKVIEV